MYYSPLLFKAYLRSVNTTRPAGANIDRVFLASEPKFIMCGDTSLACRVQRAVTGQHIVCDVHYWCRQAYRHSCRHRPASRPGLRSTAVLILYATYAVINSYACWNRSGTEENCKLEVHRPHWSADHVWLLPLYLCTQQYYLDMSATTAVLVHRTLFGRLDYTYSCSVIKVWSRNSHYR